MLFHSQAVPSARSHNQQQLGGKIREENEMMTLLTSRRRMKTGFACFAAVLLLFSTAALAQFEKGAVAGTISDASGAVIQGATVTVTGAGTNAVRTTTTDNNGSYAVTNLAPGAYVLKVAQTGFGETKQGFEIS